MQGVLVDPPALSTADTHTHVAIPPAAAKPPRLFVEMHTSAALAMRLGHPPAMASPPETLGLGRHAGGWGF